MSSVNSRKKALVVAVSEYDENSSLNNLQFCKKDGDEMLTLLKDLGYEIKNLDGLVGYVDGRLMQDCVYSFFKDDDIKSDDTILFYFSGHGVPGEDDFFLASSNIDPRRPKMRGFSFADLNGEITHCRAKRVVVILDSCYAGSLNVSGKGSESALASAAKNRMSATFKEGEGKCLLSSCMGFQESFATAEGDHSFFTNYLLKGLRGAEGKSVDDNGIVTPESLMNYIDHEIDNLEEKVQTPFRKIESAGKIALASYPQLVTRTSSRQLFGLDPKKIPKSISRPQAVGRITSRAEHMNGFTTGFLIGPNTILTVDYTMESKESAANCTIEFNFGNDEDGNPLPAESYKLNPDEIFIKSDHGFFIIGTDGFPGKKFGWLSLCETQSDIVVGDYVYLIHHTRTDKRARDLYDNMIRNIHRHFIIYETRNMDPGSAGSPVFDTKWNLLGVHTGSLSIDGASSPNMKSALRIDTIVSELKRMCDEKDSMACKVLESSKSELNV